MLEWSSPAIILSKRPFGETSAIVHVLTPDMGLCSGLFRGAKSKKNRAVIEVGNLVNVTWNARLNDQLGFFDFELLHSPLPHLLQSHGPLGALKIASDLLSIVLAEREPHPNLYARFLDLIEDLKNNTQWLEDYIRFEIFLLRELGFGLSLTECAVTGSTHDLLYVSPKTGRAVSKEIGLPYAPQLLILPAFLTQGTSGDVSQYDQALKLTGYFLEKHALNPFRKDLLLERFRLVK